MRRLRYATAAALALALLPADARRLGAFPWSIDMFRGDAVVSMSGHRE